MNIFLRKVFGKRFTEPLETVSSSRGTAQTGHLFFLDLYKRFPHDIFLTLFRHPVDQAMSFFHYVNDRDKLPVWLGKVNILSTILTSC